MFRYKVLILLLLLPLNAAAETMIPEEVFVSESSLGKYTCALIQNKWMPGKLKKDGKSFTSFDSDIVKQKLKLQLATDDKKLLLQARLNSLKKINKSGKTACKKGPIQSSTPVATATLNNTGSSIPNATPTRTPTPIPTLTVINFDSQGNVTEKGKIVFGIPANLSANINRGMIIHVDNNCTGCHSEKSGRNYYKLINTLPYSPNFFQLSTQEYADLTAYLNRFRP
jgi:hypothetical protein